jgi:hypothetical protein
LTPLLSVALVPKTLASARLGNIDDAVVGEVAEHTGDPRQRLGDSDHTEP